MTLAISAMHIILSIVSELTFEMVLMFRDLALKTTRIDSDVQDLVKLVW